MVKHVEVGYKMEAPEGCPTEIYEMMRQAWDLNPLRRPTFHDLKSKLLHLKNITTWNTHEQVALTVANSIQTQNDHIYDFDMIWWYDDG